MFNLNIDCNNYKRTKMILICYVLSKYMKTMVIYIIFILKYNSLNIARDLAKKKKTINKNLKIKLSVIKILFS